MAIHAITAGQSNRPSPRSNHAARVQAPIQGIDTRVALGEGSPLNCVYTYNMVPYEYGMQIRKGYREWQIDLETAPAAGAGVHTIIPFDGIEEQGDQDKLFAVTNEGIWDVTVDSAAPILKFTFVDQAPAAGYGVYTHYVADNEDDILFYADSINGLFEYNPATEVWAQATNITGPVIENISFIVVHKQRIWFIEENSTKAWYLPVGSKQGQCTEFFFGSKFKHGGNLAGLYNWTVDGGDGVDDYLVAVSRSGDVLPYRGNDPADVNTWELVGTYFIGKLPKGPFFGSEHGGELYLLSSYGVITMNDLLKGVDTVGSASAESRITTAKITGFLRLKMDSTISQYGWAVRSIPSEGAILIASPTADNQRAIQYYYNYAVGAWGFWRDVPMTAFDTWQGSVIIGTADNRVMIMDTTVDNALITPPEQGVNGEPVEFSILTSYQDLGAPALFKHVQLIRPDFLSRGEPSYQVVAKYDYDYLEPQIETEPPFLDGGAWDVGLWDAAIWGLAEQNAYNDPKGAWNLGRYMAIATIGKAREATRLIGWDVVFKVGGPLL